MVWGFPRFLTGELKELAGQAREGRRIQRCIRMRIDIGRTPLALGLRARAHAVLYMFWYAHACTGCQVNAPPPPPPPPPLAGTLLGLGAVSGNRYRYTEDLLQLERCSPRRGSVPTQLQPLNTPLRVRAWAEALQEHPDRAFTSYLLRGIREGFRIGYARGGGACGQPRVTWAPRCRILEW